MPTVPLSGCSTTGRVVIIGAGVFGLSAAVSLRRRFLSTQHVPASLRPCHCYSEVVVLEASSALTNPLAASNDVNRIVRADYGSDELYTDLALAAIDGWHDFNARHSSMVYDECGLLILTEGALESEQFEYRSYEDMRRRGVPVERVRAADGGLAARFPLHSASGFYSDGYFNPRAGFVDNELATQLLGEEAAQLGVDIRRGVQCVSLSSTSDNKRTATGVLTSLAGVLSADLILLCTGAWLPSLVPYTSSLLRPSAQPVVYLSASPSLSSALSAASFPVCAASLSASGFYFFPLSARPLLDPSVGCGGRVVKVAHHGRGLAGRVDPSADRHCPPAVSARIAAHIKAAMPVLAQCDVVGSKLCFYCDSADGDWLIDRHSQYDNVVVCGGDRFDTLHTASTELVDCQHSLLYVCGCVWTYGCAIGGQRACFQVPPRAWRCGAGHTDRRQAVRAAQAAICLAGSGE